MKNHSIEGSHGNRSNPRRCHLCVSRPVAGVLLPALLLMSGLSLTACQSNSGSTSADLIRPSGNRSEAQGAPVKISGSSSAIAMVKKLSQDYAAQSQAIAPTFLELGQSENAIAGVKQGVIDFAAIAKQLKAEEQDGTLAFKEIAQDGLLVAVHPSVTGVTTLTTEQLQGIYSGKIANWKELGGPDAAIVLLDRPEDESAKRLLRQHYLGPDLANSPKAIVLRKESELVQALQNTPNSIGAFSLARALSERLPVTSVSLNGIAPTLENIKQGKYKMTRTIGIVTKTQASEGAQKLLQFLTSPEGQSRIESLGFMASAAK